MPRLRPATTDPAGPHAFGFLHTLRIVVIGVGNILGGDEGLGIHALQLLRTRLEDPRVTYIDGGMMAFSVLPYLEDATHILFLDALDSTHGGTAGTAFDFPLRDQPRGGVAVVLPHDLGLRDLLVLLNLRRSGAAPTMRLIGAVPAALTPGAGLSERASRAILEVVSRAENVLELWLGDAARA